MPKDYRLVYSTDPELNRRCPRCKEVASECICSAESDAELAGGTAVLRIEKKGRGGKSVTVIDKLPANRKLVEDLAARLKKRCGAGGTGKVEEGRGIVEIQGDKRDEVRALLEAEGLKVKG